MSLFHVRSKTLNKLQEKTYPCVFISYSSQHKGCCSMHPSSRHVYLSRRVGFNESRFPFLNTNNIKILPTQNVETHLNSDIHEDTTGINLPSVPNAGLTTTISITELIS